MHTHTERPRRMFWLFRPTCVRAGSPHAPIPRPTEEVRTARKLQRADVFPTVQECINNVAPGSGNALRTGW